MEEVKNKGRSPSNREAKLLALYKDAFPMVARFVSRRGGSFEQAKDVFQDALIIWFEKVECNKERINSDKAYLFGVAKYLWLRKFGQNISFVDMETDRALEIEDLKEQSPSTSRILSLLEYSGQKCLALLKSFYYDKFSMLEIAQSFGFRTERSATVQKYKCLEKVRETVKEKALQYEDFLE